MTQGNGKQYIKPCSHLTKSLFAMRLEVGACSLLLRVTLKSSSVFSKMLHHLLHVSERMCFILFIEKGSTVEVLSPLGTSEFLLLSILYPKLL